MRQHEKRVLSKEKRLGRLLINAREDNPLTPLKIALPGRLLPPPIEDLLHRLFDGKPRGVQKKRVGIML